MNRFVDQLLADYRGQIIVCNIIDGLDENLYDENFIRNLLDWWKDLYLLQTSPSYSAMLLTLPILVFENVPNGFRVGMTKPNFRLICCRPIRLINDETKLTTVVSASTFRRIINKKDLDRLHSQGVEFPSHGSLPWNEEAINSLMKLPQTHRHIRLDAGETIGRYLLWYTMKKDFEVVLSVVVDSADQSRDSLGLVQYKEGEILIALYFSGKALKNISSGRPTFSDAGTHTRFKTCADTSINRRRNTWGHTTNLRHFASGKQNLDGLPERIADPIDEKALENEKIGFTPLGRVKVSRGDTIYDDNACFAKRLLKNRSVDILKHKIMRILL
jgi:hypothetical protein